MRLLICLGKHLQSGLIVREYSENGGHQRIITHPAFFIHFTEIIYLLGLTTVVVAYNDSTHDTNFTSELDRWILFLGMSLDLGENENEV